MRALRNQYARNEQALRRDAVARPLCTSKWLLVCIVTAVPLLANGASHDLKTFITEYDLNHDGSVSKEEFAQERDRRFAATDANHDGGLSHDEYVGEYRERLTRTHPDAKKIDRQMKQADVRFTVLDSNHDGRISPAEYAHSGWSMFTHHDYTKDGAVSAQDDVEGSNDDPDAAGGSGSAREAASADDDMDYAPGRAAAATKTDTPLIETPQSITVITAGQIRDQASLNLQEALRYAPGVRHELYGIDNRGDCGSDNAAGSSAR